MTLKRTLLELKKLMEKWGLEQNDWSLILHYADILHGYKIKYGRDEHLHVIVPANKFSWQPKDKLFNNETPVPPQTKYGREFDDFIKKTDWDFHLFYGEPRLFKRLIKSYSTFYKIGKEKIRIMTPLGNLVFDQSEIPKWQKRFSPEIIVRRLFWLELVAKEAKRRGDKAVVKLANQLIKKYKPKDKNIIQNKKSALVYFKKHHFIKGEVGFSGKIRGRVFYIKNPDKVIKKVKKNIVLVAKLTSPKLVPQIKAAKAVVTDEGGKLSHAAIICREFKIPCIVGTQIATQVLKDGDLVEVDANKGIVKIFKK